MFDTWYVQNKKTVLGWLHELHRHPEAGFQEEKTAAFVAARLREAGLDVVTGLGGTGVVGTLYGERGAGRTIGLRAELDALPMCEKSGLHYASTVADRFHGCGHDGHMVTLLAAASHLAANPDFSGTAHFIFQPAEELLTGAVAMIRDGMLERFPCDEIYAFHNLPGIPDGHVGIPGAAALASSDNIDLTIHAAGTHGSAPQTGQDGVLAAAALVTAIQQISTRIVDARTTSVISFGVIQGGSVRNILPDRVEVQGTMRTYDMAVRDRLAQAIEETARGIEIIHGVRIEVAVTNVVPPTLNHEATNAAVAASATRVIGSDRVLDAVPIMASDDFSRFLEHTPGTYFFVGHTGHYPHHPAYTFDPEIIPVGAAIFVDLVHTRGPRMSATPSQ